MRKIFLSCTLCILLLSVLLCGCHSERKHAPVGEETFFDTSAFDEEKNYEITFWAKNDSNISQVEIYEKAISDFEALYPNIKIKYKPYNDYRRIYNDVITNIATDTTPNVCITYPDHIATYLSGKDTVVELDALMADKSFGLGGERLRFDSPKKEEIAEKFLDEGKVSGKQYALPFMRSTEALYINKTLVEKLGYTIPDEISWDFIWEVSEAAMIKDGDGNFLVNNQKVMIPFIYKSTDNMMIQMLQQQNAPYSSENGEILIFNDYTRDILTEIARHAESRSFSTFKISSYPGNFFNANQCIFAIDSTAGATWLGTNAPNFDISEENIAEFEMEVRAIPQYDTENPKMISQGPSVCLFDKEDKGEVIASWLFLQFLLTDDVQVAYSQTEGYIPVTLKAQNSPEYREYLSLEGADNDLHYDIKIKASKLLLDNIENTFVTPVFNGSADLRSAAGEMIEIVAKQVRRGSKADESLIDEALEKANSLYRLESIVAHSSNQKKMDFGPLPAGSKALLISLSSVWVLLAIYFLISKTRRK